MDKGKALPKKLVVKIDATHAGIVNGNLFMYLPDGMRGKGEESFTKPYNKPVTDGHPSFFENEKDTPVLGRVIDAKYESYDLFPEMDSLPCREEEIVDLVQKTYRMQMSDDNFKGLGQMTVTAEITDEEAIKQIMDKRKLTVSIGSFIDNARCSVCGSRWNTCEHELNNSYDGKVAFRVGGKMKFDHVAFVKRPADENAMVSSVQVADNNDGSFTILVHDEVQIMDVTESKTLKETIVDAVELVLAGPEGKRVKAEHLDAYRAASEKGRQHSYLFSDSKDVYLKDKLGLLVAKITLDGIEESTENKDELESLKSVVDTLLGTGKFVEALEDGQTYMDLYDTLLEDETTEEAADTATEGDKVVDNVVISQQTIDSIAEAVFNKIKQGNVKTDAYAKDRIKTLELALIELEDKLAEADANMVTYATKVGGENITDATSAKEFFDSMEANNVEVEVEDKELEKLDLNDNIIEDKDNTEENVEDTVEDSTDTGLDFDEVRDTYKELLREHGFKDAKAYLKGLKDSGKIPDNFIL